MAYHFAETIAGDDAPLIMTFHGTGGDETQFHGLAAQLLPGASVISPRGDVSENGMARFFRRKAEGVYDMDDLARRTAAMSAFVAEQRDRLRPPRVVGLGYSNGANILASALFENAGLFDAVILMHPLIPWQPDPNPELSTVRVLITAGQRDPICPPDMTRALTSYFIAQGAETQTEWHPGGHEIAQAELSAAHGFLNTKG